MKKSLIILTIILSFCLLLVGCGASVTQGEKGDKGDKGEQGEQGESGRGVEKFEIIDGELIIYYTDGTSQNLGKIESGSSNNTTLGLEYYPLDNGTLAVAVGNAALLSEIVIPSTYQGVPVTQIKEAGFEEATNLKKITIPKSVTNIGKSAFFGCSSLEQIVIPDSVTTIGSDVFYDCSLLTIYCEVAIKPNGWDSSWVSSSRPVYWYSEEEPTNNGNYWHYVDGEVTIWDTSDKEEKNYAENNTKIKIGLSGPLTGGAAMYGIAVKNSAQMAIDEINAFGGLNGIMLELIMLDDKHDANNIATNYASLYEGGMQVSLGTVTTKPGLEFKGYAQADNVFFLTPSATGDDIPEYSNGYQMCFADSDQGTVSAGVFKDEFQGKKIGVFFKADDDYSVGIKNNFVKALGNALGEVKMASFTEATKSSFTQQVSELKDCDVIFMPIYTEPAALFMQQGKGIIKADAIYYGCDGLDGIDAEFDVSTITQGISYLSHFNSGATEGAAKTYIDAYVKEYGESAPLNHFGASAYDSVYAIYEAMNVALENGKEIPANISPSDLCEILKEVFNSPDFEFDGITCPDGTTIKWTDDEGNPTNGYVNKDGTIHVVKEITK